MSSKFYSSFFVENIRSKELKKRLEKLNEHRMEIAQDPERKSEALMLELIIGLSYQVDYSTNPDTNDEIFSKITQESDSFRKDEK